MKTTRSEFLKTVALGAAALGAAATVQKADAQPVPAASGSDSAPDRGFIDLHSHWFSPAAVDILSKRDSPPRFVRGEDGQLRLARGAGELGADRGMPLGRQWLDIDLRLADLDRNGVAHQLISWPTTMNVDADLEPADAKRLWAAYNDDLAAAAGAHADRLSGVAALASGDIEWSARELERAHEKLGLIGAVLPANGFASLEGAKAFAPVLEVAQRHRSHLYLHTGYAYRTIPGQPPRARYSDSAQARAALDNAWNFAAATITLAFSGFLDAYPDVTVQVAQLGGSGAIALVAEQVRLGAARNPSIDLKRAFNRITLDTGAGGRGPEAIALAVRVFGAGNVVFGTDFAPQPSVAPVIQNIRRSPIADSDRRKVLIENAKAILITKGVRV